ncbi:MAG: hydrogenase nickel incorporation protein HypB [Candidatus Lokiarchaeota archaeon]|nr:hydrogenase nickel incorporation protein HypB [Candidatus Lokiarchaeota archaeon]
MSEWDKIISVEEDLIKANIELANDNTQYFKKKGIRAFEVLGNIGSGKTSIIKKVIEKIKDDYNIAVINGDIAGDPSDIERLGVKTLQINTGGECHLDAKYVRPFVDKLPNDTNLCFIENVGNLICPFEFPLGCEHRIVVVGLTDGPYIIRKHPVTFRIATVIVINKMDLGEVLETDSDQLIEDCHKINSEASVILTSAKTGRGIDKLIKALKI